MRIDLTGVDKPRKVEPKLLLHTTIPTSLSTINPRNLLGKELWDKVRKDVYASNNMFCQACGIGDVKLDAHECYEYSQKPCIATFKVIVPLCNSCHMYIHWMSVEPGKRLKYLQHGAKILLEAGLNVPRLVASKLSFTQPVPRNRQVEVYDGGFVVDLMTASWLLDIKNIYKYTDKHIKRRKLKQIIHKNRIALSFPEGRLRL